MRPSRLAATALAVTLLAAACSDDGGSAANRLDLSSGGLAPSVDDIQPDVADGSVVGLDYTDFDGNVVRFEAALGTPQVINFFAQWCPNCIAEMPDFEAVSQELGGSVKFTGISIDDTPDAALQLVAATGVTYDVGWDPDESLFSFFGGLAMPTTVFVDADGHVARVFSGGLDGPSLRDLINQELG